MSSAIECKMTDALKFMSLVVNKEDEILTVRSD